MSQTAIITGIAGQDGAYLAQFLLAKGYKVYGILKDKSDFNLWRLKYLDILDQCDLISFDVRDACAMFDAVKSCQPDEIYHLAALAVAASPVERPVDYGEVNGLAVTNVLEAVRCLNKSSRIYFASSIQMFGPGMNLNISQEINHFAPGTPYAMAKLYGFWMAHIYRNTYGMFVCNGIMSNHESPLRSLDFVTRKITNEAAKISLGLGKKLVLGNLETSRDWGYAADFVRAMWLMLQGDKPQDFILATGERHTLKEFLEKAFSAVNLNWQDYVIQDNTLLRRNDDYFDAGSTLETCTKLGWRPEINFDQLVEIMVNQDLLRWKRHLKGDRFPWDIL
jgi:GDPmannose 4,6-dehydratase